MAVSSEVQIVVELEGQRYECVQGDCVRLGSGAEGTVFEWPTGQGGAWAYKRYAKPSLALEEKVAAMVMAPPVGRVLPADAYDRPQFAWPIAIVRENGQFSGFLMPLVDHRDSDGLEKYLEPTWVPATGLETSISIPARLEIARNLAAVVLAVHRAGHRIIDFKPQNIRVYRRSHLVALLDCDSFAVAGRYPASGYSSEYIHPQALNGHLTPQALGEDQDAFALAVLIFQLLNRGIHPFSGITRGDIRAESTDDKVAQGLYPYAANRNPKITPSPYSQHELLPQSLRALFDRSFTNSHGEGSPAPGEWIGAIDSLLRSELTSCVACPSDVTHIHFKGNGCVQCSQGRRASSPSVKSQSHSGQWAPSPPRSAKGAAGLPSPAVNSPVRRNPAIGVWFLAVACVVLLLVMSLRSPKSTSKRDDAMPTAEVGRDSASGQWPVAPASVSPGASTGATTDPAQQPRQRGVGSIAAEGTALKSKAITAAGPSCNRLDTLNAVATRLSVDAQKYVCSDAVLPDELSSWQPADQVRFLELSAVGNGSLNSAQRIEWDGLMARHSKRIDEAPRSNNEPPPVAVEALGGLVGSPVDSIGNSVKLGEAVQLSAPKIVFFRAMDNIRGADPVVVVNNTSVAKLERGRYFWVEVEKGLGLKVASTCELARSSRQGVPEGGMSLVPQAGEVYYVELLHDPDGPCADDWRGRFSAKVSTRAAFAASSLRTVKSSSVIAKGVRTQSVP